jgi:RNA polymerase sigma factor (sigma-70 family)
MARKSEMSSVKPNHTQQNHSGNRLINTYFKEVAALPIPTAAKEKELFTAYAAAPDRNPDAYGTDGPIAGKIKQEIAQGYLRFVMKQALARTKDEHLLLDLLAAGNEGLLIGIKKFDVNRGTRFLTYGASWVKVLIQNALHAAGLGRQPIIHESFEEIDTDADPEPFPDKPARSQMIYMSDHTQLAVVDANIESDMSVAHFNMLRELKEACLTRKETLILIYYYGLRGGVRQTFGQLSKILLDLEGVYISSERVRQIKEHALRNLRKAFKRKKISSVTDVF